MRWQSPRPSRRRRHHHRAQRRARALRPMATTRGRQASPAPDPRAGTRPYSIVHSSCPLPPRVKSPNHAHPGPPRRGRPPSSRGAPRAATGATAARSVSSDRSRRPSARPWAGLAPRGGEPVTRPRPAGRTHSAGGRALSPVAPCPGPREAQSRPGPTSTAGRCSCPRAARPAPPARRRSHCRR